MRIKSKKHDTVTLYRHADHWRFCTPWRGFDRRMVYVVRGPDKQNQPWTIEEWSQKDGLIGTNEGRTMREAIEHTLTTFVWFTGHDFTGEPTSFDDLVDEVSA